MNNKNEILKCSSYRGTEISGMINVPICIVIHTPVNLNGPYTS